MSRNVEIKAAIDSVAAMAALVAPLADAPGREIVQDDTFFHCEAGRLKLRVNVGADAELIFYRRPELFLIGRIRVHLDEVLHLGEFLELEVVLGAMDTVEGGSAEAQALMSRLGVHPGRLIDRAYVDLLAQRLTSPAGRSD